MILLYYPVQCSARQQRRMIGATSWTRTAETGSSILTMIRHQLLKIAMDDFGSDLGRNWDFICAHASVAENDCMRVHYFLVKRGIVTALRPTASDHEAYCNVLAEEREAFSDEFEVEHWIESRIEERDSVSTDFPEAQNIER